VRGPREQLFEVVVCVSGDVLTVNDHFDLSDYIPYEGSIEVRSFLPIAVQQQLRRTAQSRLLVCLRDVNVALHVHQLLRYAGMQSRQSLSHYVHFLAYQLDCGFLQLLDALEGALELGFLFGYEDFDGAQALGVGLHQLEVLREVCFGVDQVNG